MLWVCKLTTHGNYKTDMLVFCPLYTFSNQCILGNNINEVCFFYTGSYFLCYFWIIRFAVKFMECRPQIFWLLSSQQARAFRHCLTSCLDGSLLRLCCDVVVPRNGPFFCYCSRHTALFVLDVPLYC